MTASVAGGSRVAEGQVVYQIAALLLVQHSLQSLVEDGRCIADFLKKFACHFLRSESPLKMTQKTEASYWAVSDLDGISCAVACTAVLCFTLSGLRALPRFNRLKKGFTCDEDEQLFRKSLRSLLHRAYRMHGKYRLKRLCSLSCLLCNCMQLSITVRDAVTAIPLVKPN